MLQPKDKLHTVLTIEAIIRELEDFRTIRFRNDHSLQYSPGQYLTLVHSYDASGSEIRRSYSILSSPVLDKSLSIGVKRIDNGIFSRLLVDKANPGDQLLCAGVGGFFTLPASFHDIDNIFFFAAGSGITPILSLLTTLLNTNPFVKAILIYSNHSKETTAYYQILLQLESDFKGRFSLILLFSRTADLKTARLNRDLLLSIINEHAANRATSRFYVCGPEAYMRMVVFTLQEQGYPRSLIKKEDFIQTKPTYSKPKPPETGSHKAILNFKGTIFGFTVDYPDTILQAAKKEAITLPYSCETGKCGNCVAICTKGQVWMSENEVLTDDQLKNGMVLTCVGHPINGDVSLVIE